MVYNYESADHVNFLLSEENQNCLIVDIDGCKLKNTDDFFTNISKVLFFPSYFGHNWNALDECVNDLEWLDDSINEISIIVRNADMILSSEEDSEKEILVSCLNNASDYWNNKNEVHNHSMNKFDIYYISGK